MSIQKPENWQSLLQTRSLAKEIRASGFPTDQSDLKKVIEHTKAEWDLLGSALGNSCHVFDRGTVTFAFNGKRFQGIAEEDSGASYPVWPNGGLRPPNIFRRIAAIGEVAAIFVKDLTQGDQDNSNQGTRRERQEIRGKEEPLALRSGR